MKIKNENEPDSSLLKLEITGSEKIRSYMIDATSATCVRLSVTRRSIVDRLNAYFSCVQNSSSVRLHLTSRFRLSIESTRLVVFTIYGNFFPPFSSYCFFCLSSVQRVSEKLSKAVALKSTCSRIFSNSILAGLPLIPHASNHLYVNST